MRSRGWLRDPAWLAVVFVSATAIGSVVAMAATRLAIPSEDATISTGDWPWTADGVVVNPVDSGSRFRPGDRVVAVAGRSLADWATDALAPPWFFRPTVLPSPLRFDVLRDGTTVSLDAPLRSTLVQRFGGAPPALVVFALTALVLALALILRRPQAIALRLLLLGVTCDVANIVAWETGLQPTDLVARTPFLIAFALAPVFAIVFWASLVHLLAVYPARAGRLIASPRSILLSYLLPLLALAIGSVAAAALPGGPLAWIGRLGPVTAAVISVQIVAVLLSIVAGYRRTPVARRPQIRLIAATLFVAAAAELLLVAAPIALGRPPLASRATVAVLALPVVAALAIAVFRDHLFQVELIASSRTRLVAAREEERRRLRRELHDGLGPALAAVALKVDAARDDVEAGDRDAAVESGHDPPPDRARSAACRGRGRWDRGRGGAAERRGNEVDARTSGRGRRRGDGRTAAARRDARDRPAAVGRCPPSAGAGNPRSRRARGRRRRGRVRMTAPTSHRAAGATPRIRLVVADDHPVYRDGLLALAGRSPDIEVVAQAATGVDAVSEVLRVSPDVVLMDLRMPGMSGIEATRAILAEQPDARVLILTMSEDDDSLFAAMRAGARGYLPKDAASDELVHAIRAAAIGEVIFGASIAARMQRYFAASRARAVDPFPDLTERENEVLELVARGHSNAEIGRRLGITDKTVRNHVASIFNKLRVADRGQAIVRARNAGVGLPDDSTTEPSAPDRSPERPPEQEGPPGPS